MGYVSKVSKVQQAGSALPCNTVTMGWLDWPRQARPGVDDLFGRSPLSEVDLDRTCRFPDLLGESRQAR